MPKYKIFITITVVEIIALGSLYLWSQFMVSTAMVNEIPAKQELVQALGLTDLALFTEARYTRHPSQADNFSAFQDFPGALEHFPAGSIITPERSFDRTSLSFQKEAR